MSVLADDPGPLTDAEHKALDLTADLMKAIYPIVGDGPTREHDLREFVTDIHNIQRRIAANAAARAYPRRYRLLGMTITKEADET